MGSPLNVATAGHIQIWTINRPDVGNAITGLDIIEALEEAVYAANADTEVRAVILTGAGRIFSAGGNVKDMADRQGMFGVDERAQRRAYVAGISASRARCSAWRSRSSPRSTVPPSAPGSTWR